MAGISGAKELSALIVGLGSIGVRHLGNLRRLGCGKIGALRQRNLPLHTEVDLGDVPIYSDYGEALGQGYKAVILCNPTSMHVEYAFKAAEAGCHLYIEKPVSNSLEGLADLEKRLEETGTVAAVGCQFRFHPNLLAIQKWLSEKRVGRVLSVQVDTGEYLPGWHPWEDYRASYSAQKKLGGGVILTLIHEIDYLFWLLGPMKTLCAIGGNSGALEIDAEEHLSALLKTESGTAVELHLDYLQKPPSRRMKIIGSEGMILWDYFEGEAGLTVKGEKADDSRVPPGWERNDLFVAVMKNFIDCVCEKSAPRVPLSDGIEVLKIALELKENIGRR
jgi:predicted dehydrogenase